jgi:S-adenosylmethionine synthetase
MIEKVNPSHPDKVADRIAGALVDLAYTKNDRPKIAVEVLIGHGTCHIIAETSEKLGEDGHTVGDIVRRITGNPKILIDYEEVPQDAHLAANQKEEARCGDNGIFKGVPTSMEEQVLSARIREMYTIWPSDGKFIYDEAQNLFIACQSNATREEIEDWLARTGRGDEKLIINPLGDWTGGTDVDTGATNRKLGSDMGRAVTGGGLHGKDLSKADVAVNIACHIMANQNNSEVSALCAIGDKEVRFAMDGAEDVCLPYSAVLDMASGFIKKLGGFEKLAEWGLF